MLEFKVLELEDKPVFDRILSEDPPRISELTFTNLFMWRFKYRPLWTVHDACLLIILRGNGDSVIGLPPTGTGNKAVALDILWDAIVTRSDEPVISRVDSQFVENFVDTKRFRVNKDRDNSDYVYRAEDLIKLTGNRYHQKRNHVNKFLKSYRFEYQVLNDKLVKDFLGLQDSWCQLKDCESNEDLLAEDRAVFEALLHYKYLGLRGGAILIEDKVEAFTLGEKLSQDTAVIHVEKANPEIPGLYATINQQFCQHEWSEVTYVNRQQDLGVPGMRKAKTSYHPDHMVDKFTLIRR